jgi:hypothetical protein
VVRRPLFAILDLPSSILGLHPHAALSSVSSSVALAQGEALAKEELRTRLTPQPLDNQAQSSQIVPDKANPSIQAVGSSVSICVHLWLNVRENSRNSRPVSPSSEKLSPIITNYQHRNFMNSTPKGVAQTFLSARPPEHCGEWTASAERRAVAMPAKFRNAYATRFGDGAAHRPYHWKQTFNHAL